MEIAIANTNIVQVPADLLVLKYADGFHGADKIVARILSFDDFVKSGDARFIAGPGLAAPEVLFLGVGPLSNFRYELIQEFGSRAIRLVRKHHRPIKHIAMTVHGPGYGLDPEQSFLSMIAGIVSEWKRADGSLQKVTIAELSDKRCAVLSQLLQERLHEFGLARNPQNATVTVVPDGELTAGSASLSGSNIIQFGARAEEQPRLFVAMPFADEFLDEFEIGFHEAAKVNAFACERFDLEAFTGDIVGEIRKRIIGSHGVIALLNNLNPNVFLEIGFAWAHDKPTILVARDGVKLPFDVSGHRCIRYRSIVDLRKALSSEIAALKARGLLSKLA